MDDLRGLLVLYIVRSTWGKNCVLEVEDTPCVAAMERMGSMLMVLKSVPLGWSIRHLLTEAYKYVWCLSTYLESCSIPSQNVLS